MHEQRIQTIRTQLTQAAVQSPPEPWQLVKSVAVGGLTHVGYANDSDLLLVISHQGRSVIDCLTGNKLARDYEEDFEDLDEIKLIAPGIGPIEKQNIRISGLSGGGLPNITDDGWHIETIALPWPKYFVFLSHLSQHNARETHWLEAATKVGDSEACEIHACGFSETGKTFVIARSCDLDIFSRERKHSISDNA